MQFIIRAETFLKLSVSRRSFIHFTIIWTQPFVFILFLFAMQSDSIKSFKVEQLEVDFLMKEIIGVILSKTCDFDNKSWILYAIKNEPDRMMTICFSMLIYFHQEPIYFEV